MSFNRDLLPDPPTYFAAQGLKLFGPRSAKWKTTACIFHGGSDSLRINTGSGGWRCMACGVHGGDVLAYHQQVHTLSFIEAAQDLGSWLDDGNPAAPAGRRKAPAKVPDRGQQMPQHPRLSERGCNIWRATVALPGTIADQYLLSRCCALPPADGHLRFHPALPHPSGHVGPALVALVTDARTREPISLHRTWIRADGSKGDVDPPRLLLGGHRKQGGVIRLWPDDSVTYGLGIAEGIETTLTLARVLKPAWSLIDAGNLAAFPVLPGVEVLTIAADNDAAGLKSANDCATRWTEAGADVRVVIPPRKGADLNDFARQGVA